MLKTENLNGSSIPSQRQESQVMKRGLLMRGRELEVQIHGAECLLTMSADWFSREQAQRLLISMGETGKGRIFLRTVFWHLMQQPVKENGIIKLFTTMYG